MAQGKEEAASEAAVPLCVQRGHVVYLTATVHTVFAL
jgi:hypothetical protein